MTGATTHERIYGNATGRDSGVPQARESPAIEATKAYGTAGNRLNRPTMIAETAVAIPTGRAPAPH